MSARLLTLALVALGFAACSSNDPEDVVLTSKETLVQSYGALAHGTFRMRHPRPRLDFQGTEMRLLSGNPSLLLTRSSESYQVVITSRALKMVDSLGAFGWIGSHNGPQGPHGCTGSLYVLESTPALLRAVFAGRCGKVNPLSGPRNFELLEGGFAYVR